jgi:flagellar L-ring protein precursor FlgH
MIALHRTWLIAVVAALALSACAVAPTTIVQQPTVARPQPELVPVPANGAIFQAASYRPLFEDRRARMVGDILTIAINERTSAGKQASSAASKSSQLDFGIPKLFGVSSSLLGNLGISTSLDASAADKGAVASSNNFTSVITVTVTDVLANGNLVVSGEKQIALDKGVEYVRFSGVVRPDSITAGNIVSSTQVADARVEYRTDTRVDTAAVVSSLARFFLSVLPF